MEWSFLDTWIVITGALSAMSCALLGNYLVLRRMSMMGDAISHAVLPGLAIAFLITGTRESLPMLMGATAIGVFTAFMVQAIYKLGRLEEGAAMGVIFTSLFALGLILIRQAADHVDLDPGCVLYGAIELTPIDTLLFLGMEIPKSAITSFFMWMINGLFVIVFFKELKIVSFDPSLASTMGINATLMHYILMTLVAATTVIAFENVGSILVIAMLIVPAASAYLLTNRLWLMVVMSQVIAISAAVLGHVGAITVPSLFGFEDTSTAGMIAVAAGVLFTLVFFFAPKSGLVSRTLSRFSLTLKILRDDILGFLYRYQEVASEDAGPARITHLIQVLNVNQALLIPLWDLKRKGLIIKEKDQIHLTDEGEKLGRSLVRSHRLWEAYLCEKLDVCMEDVHSIAHKLEHVTNPEMQSELKRSAGNPLVDPHKREIP